MSQNLNSTIQRLVDFASMYMEGETLTRPLLRTGDGITAQYVVDVKIPGLRIIQTAGVITEGDWLHDVVIASNVTYIQSAEVGSAVTLRRSPSTGKFEVVGFASKKPGSYKRFSVSVSAGTGGTLTDVGLTSRRLTLSELQSYGGGFGLCPFGATAIFQGATLIRLGV